MGYPANSFELPNNGFGGVLTVVSSSVFEDPE